VHNDGNNWFTVPLGGIFGFPLFFILARGKKEITVENACTAI
jgi:hypothetical protein